LPAVARRIIVFSADPNIGQLLASALTVGGAVDLHQTLGSLGPGELQAALYVLHLEGDLTDLASHLLPRLKGGPVIAVLPRSDLAAVVELMQRSDRVAGVIFAADGPLQISAIAMRILADDIFGLEKVLVSGTQIHSQTVGDYEEKTRCMSAISEFVEGIGAASRNHREPIAQCIDEMLMNALYDAPVDKKGTHIFAGTPTRARIMLRTEQKVVVQYGYDGKQFAVSVRDAFGSLGREMVLRNLSKSLHAEQPVDRRAGGAGLGLYLMTNAASTVHFNVLPGIATEALCAFDLETSNRELDQFGFFVQTNTTGQAATAPARQIFAGSPRRRLFRVARRALVVLIPAWIVVLGFLAWPRLFGAKTARFTFTAPAGATIVLDGRTVGLATNGTLSVDDLEIGRDYSVIARLDGYEPKQAVVRPERGTTNELVFELPALARVDLDSLPTGAVIVIDGKPVGSTPLSVTSLAPGASVSIAFEQRGYRAATAQVQVPERGHQTRLVQKLEISDQFVRVHFVSNPPGAEIIKDGKRTVDRTFTPADVFVEANQVQHFTLAMPKYVPLVIAPFTPPRGSNELEKGGDLTAIAIAN
jgi:hypothetical protein